MPAPFFVKNYENIRTYQCFLNETDKISNVAESIITVAISA